MNRKKQGEHSGQQRGEAKQRQERVETVKLQQLMKEKKDEERENGGREERRARR